MQLFNFDLIVPEEQRGVADGEEGMEAAAAAPKRRLQPCAMLWISTTSQVGALRRGGPWQMAASHLHLVLNDLHERPGKLS